MSRYANFDHAGWLRDHIRGRGLSPLGERVATIIGITGGGIYNAPVNLDKVDWSDAQMIRLVWQRDLDTFDFDRLTKLVFLCHEARIRCELDGCGPHLIRMSFWQRAATGDISHRHPNLEEAVAEFRAWFPVDHPLRYQDSDSEGRAA